MKTTPSLAAAAARRARAVVDEPERPVFAVLVVAVFALAYGSPIETYQSDPGLALIAAQAVVEHRSLRLDPYVGREELSYDLHTDYRTRGYAGVYYPNSLGVPILSVPFVWVANRAGYDMLDLETEFATQNLLSALSCALLFVLLFHLCRQYVGRWAALTFATVSVLGTSLMSTGGTGLWNSNYSLLFITAALLRLIRSEDAGMSLGELAVTAALLLGGFLCRPSTAFFALAVLVYLLGEPDRRIVASAAAGLLATGLALFLPMWVPVPVPWMAAHYSPARLRFTNSPGVGLYGVLLSPSRGLFIFSPFLALVAAGAIGSLRALRRDRIFRLCLLWIALHTFTVATNDGKWWGGHSFGPRMLIDVIPAFVVLGCILWRHLERRARGWRTPVMAAYVALGLFAIGVHSGQGLFNPSTQAWNLRPDVDENPELALDWRYPQFLASRTMIESRLDDHARRIVEARRGSLPAYTLGRPIAHDSEEVIFVHWHEPEPFWRWTLGGRGSIVVRLSEVRPDRLHVLQLRVGSLGHQRISVRVNGVPVAEFEHDGFEPSWKVAVLPRGTLRPRTENDIELLASDPSIPANDYRELALALHELRLEAPQPGTAMYGEDPFFGSGFSIAEEGWRWTEEMSAVLYLPVGAVAAERMYTVNLRARPHGQQRVALGLNGVLIGETTYTGPLLTSIEVAFPGSLLRPWQINRLELRLPDAVPTTADSRRLGLAIVSVSVSPQEAVTPVR